jgi:AraC-like DNA-binding protein
MDIAKLPTVPPTPSGYCRDPLHPVISMAMEFDGPHRVAAHSHPRAQLLLAVRGVLRVVSASGTWVVPASQAVWVPPAVEHEVIAADSVSIRSLFVDPDAASGLPGDCRVVEVTPLLRELIAKALQVGNDYAAEGPERRLMDVLLDQLQQLPLAPLYLPMARDKRLLSVMEALLADPADERGLAAWADQAGASSRTLARLFVKESGMTFGEWRKQLRLLEAVDRLVQGQTVTRVALELGYQSSSAFIAMFRRSLGCAPGRYLRRGG